MSAKKAAATYFAIAQAMSGHEGRPLSEQELVDVKEISEGLGQERVIDEQSQGVEHLARRQEAIP